MESKLEFQFTTEETNLILNALAQQSYIQVAQLIENIKKQAGPQLQQTPVASAVDAAEPM